MGNELRWSEVGLLKDAVEDLQVYGRGHDAEKDSGAGYRVSLLLLDASGAID